MPVNSMDKWIRLILISAGTWFGSLIVSAVLILITTGVTQKWTAGRAQIVVVVVLAATILIFTAGTLFVHKTGSRILAGQGSPMLFTTLYAGGAIITVVFIGFITLIAMNR